MPDGTKFFYRLLFIILIKTSITGSLFAQDFAEVYGKITDSVNQPVPLVNIALAGQPGGTVTNADGSYSLKVPANRDLTLLITFVGFNPEKVKINLRIFILLLWCIVFCGRIFRRKTVGFFAFNNLFTQTQCSYCKAFLGLHMCKRIIII